MERSKSSSILFALMSFTLLQSTTSRGDEAGEHASTSVRLPSGLSVRYVHHYNHDSLRDSRRQGDALIALTQAGNLFAFDLATRKPTRERFDPSMVVCLGGGDGDEVIAGLEDGRVCSVEPADLKLTEIAKLPGRPQWVGYPSRGLRAG